MQASVIVPVFNSASFLPRTLPSWLEQDFAGDYELIAVDNNSTDGSLDLLRAAATEHSKLQVVTEDQQGSYSARNRGVTDACGEWLVFTDPDCVLPSHWLTTLTAPLSSSSVHAVQGPALPAGDDLGLRLLGLYECEKEQMIFGSNDPTIYYAHTNNFATTRTAFQRVGPFIQRDRGSDVIYLRSLVDHFGPSAAAHAHEAMVMHLEVDCLEAYYRKIRTYGRSCHSLSQIQSTRSLTTSERLQVYIATVRRHSLSVSHAFLLFRLLAVGVASWHRGHWSGRAEQTEGGPTI
jgi:glycosyltransferase involved in cell wall biosynthesis